MSMLKKLIDELCPEGVEFIKLGEVAKCYSGATPKTGVANYWENGTIPWMNSGEVNLGKVFYTEKRITQAGFNSCSTKIVPPHTVVIALAGQGKTRGSVAITEIELCTNQSLCAIDVDRSIVNSYYLWHYLRSQYQQLRKISSGDGTRGGLNQNMIRNYEIPVPPLSVQQEIVRILDSFTALEAELETKLEAELDCRKRQYEYYRDELFNFATDNKDVKWMTLGEIGKFVRGNGLQKKDFTEEGFPCIHYGQIYTRFGLFTEKSISFCSPELAKTLVKAKKGDMIIACTSENVEDVCKAVVWLGEGEVATGGHACVYSHNQNPKYIAYYFRSEQFFDQKKRYAKGVKVIDIKAADLEKIEIPLPPLPIQEEIVRVLDKLTILEAEIEAEIKAEIAARRKQYEYYREKLLTFKRKTA